MNNDAVETSMLDCQKVNTHARAWPALGSVSPSSRFHAEKENARTVFFLFHARLQGQDVRPLNKSRHAANTQILDPLVMKMRPTWIRPRKQAPVMTTPNQKKENQIKTIM